MLDLTNVRQNFPALDTDWALFDNAGGSAPCRAVIERVSEHMSRRPVQLGASYDLSREASAAVEEGRRAMATFGNTSPENVIVGPSTTVMVRRLARGLRAILKEGDEVVVTNLDHEANVGPWRELEEQGIVLREWRMRPETCSLEPEDLDQLLNERTRLVCFAHVSNLFGVVHDVPAICRKVREAGALSVVDGVAYAPHRRVDVEAFGADFYLFSAYKAFGPHQSVLYAKRELLESVAPSYHFFLDPMAGYEPAGLTYELASALPGMVEYLLSLNGPDEVSAEKGLEQAFTSIEQHETELVAPLLAFLDSHPRVQLWGSAKADPKRRVPTISFNVEGRASGEIPPLLDERRLAVRFGHFYAYRPVRALGLDLEQGVVRVSMVHYNTPDEVGRLIQALEEIL